MDPEDRRLLNKLSHSAQPLELVVRDRVGTEYVIVSDLEDYLKYEALEDLGQYIVISVLSAVKEIQLMEEPLWPE